jgi:lipoate-protein ligase A
MVVMGIGGKPDRLLNVDNVMADQVLVVKRFSGGGTVVMDHNSVWTTIIGRTADLPHVEPYPRSIMEWSARAVFGPAFDRLTARTITNNNNQNNGTTKRNGTVHNNDNNNNNHNTKRTLVMDTKSCSATENLGVVKRIPIGPPSSRRSPSLSAGGRAAPTVPTFSLRENDYVLNDEYKVGGNAQSIIKGGWLHHTSFLWDYDEESMERYLRLPDKRPEYRVSRSHRDFLVPLSSYYGPSYTPFLTSLREACQESLGSGRRGGDGRPLDVAHLPTVLREVIDEPFGGMEEWFRRNRTRIVHDL